MSDNEKNLYIDKLTKEIRQILNSLGEGNLSPSAYDTAWVARIPSKGDPTKPMFPQCLQWVMDNQLEDGSWGAPNVEYYHDRILSTLSCIITLEIWGRSKNQILKGVSYISETIGCLKEDSVNTIGFEVLIGSMLIKAKSLGINISLNNPTIEYYQALAKKKFSLIPIESLYNKKSSLGFSLEFLDCREDIDYSKLIVHQESNGSISCSPAATAFFLTKLDNLDAKLYLEEILKKYRNYAISFHTIDIFERSWAINYILDLDLTDFFKKEISDHLKYLQSTWNLTGISSSKYFSIVNLDDTAMSFGAMEFFGIHQDISVFDEFVNEDKYICHKGETEDGLSHIVNLHSALNKIKRKNDQTIKTLLGLNEYISKKLSIGTIDKWNISSYYVPSRLDCTNYSDKIQLSNLIEQVVCNQNIDGSWGDPSNIEETLYANLFLYKSKYYSNKSPTRSKSYEYLFKHNCNIEDFPVSYNWIAKTLYNPHSLTKLLFYLIQFKFLSF